MTLELRTEYKEWLTRAYINGAPQRLALPLPNRRLGFDTARSTAEITLMDVPAAQPGQAAFVDVGWGGELVRFFTGRVDSPSANEPALNRRMTLVDENGKIRKRLTANITWSSRNFVDAIFDVLIQVGADRVSYVYDPGLLLGPDYPITIDASKESAAEIFRLLLEYGGCTAWVAPDGAMRVENITAIPATSYAALPDGTPMVYAYGASGLELGLTSSAFVLNNAEGLTSSVTITGPKRSDGITPTGSATLSGADGEVYTANLRFVQNSTDAQAIAVRELSKRGVNPTIVTMTAPFNPYLLPGQTIGFRDETIGYSSTVPAFVWAVSNSGPEMTVTLYLGAHVLDGYTGPVPPVAVATVVQVEVEPVLIAGVSTPLYFVQMDGSASYTPTGSIVLYAWSAPGASPSTSSEQRPLFVYTDITDRIITLTVTSDTGQINTVNIAVPTADSEVVTRQLSVAEGTNGWAVLLDRTGWQSLTRPGRSCTAVPSFNESGPLLSGWDDGAIYGLSGTAPATLAARGTVTGSITCVFVNENDASNVLVCAGTKLYRSTSGGLTFTVVHDFGAGNTTRDAQSSPSNANEIRVAAGSKTYISYDGATFTAVINGATGTSALTLASAPWGHAGVFSGGSTPTDALKFEEGYGVAWTEVTTPPTSLHSIYPLLATPGFIAADASGNLYLLSQVGVNFNATLLSVSLPATDIPDAIRDGQLNGLAFLATAAGAQKLINNALIYQLRTNPALQIGYGALRSLIRVLVSIARLYLGTGGAKVARYSAVSGWSTVSGGGLPTSGAIDGVALAQSPVDKNKWLLLINTASESYKFDVASGNVVRRGTSAPVLYYSGDDMATWTAVALPHPYATASTSGIDCSILQVIWSDISASTWWAIGASDSGAIHGNTTWFWRGTNGTATLGSTYIPGYLALYGDAGANDDLIVVSQFPSDQEALRYATSAASSFTTPTGTLNLSGHGARTVARGIGTSRVVVVAENGYGLHATADYRTTQPAAKPMTLSGSAVTGTHVVPLADGSWLFTGGVSRIVRITNITNATPTAVLEYAGGGEYTALASDTSGTVAAATINGSRDLAVYDGTNWAILTGPTGSDTLSTVLVVGAT